MASILYAALFLAGIKVLFHGFPDIERFFAEWMDEKLTLTIIMKFGTLNFAPTQIWHPPLYHYLTFIPIAIFFLIGKLAGFFNDKTEFLKLYFNNTYYFLFVGRMMSYIFYWLSAVMVYKIARLFYIRMVSHLTVISYLLIPVFIFDFSTIRPEPLLFLNTSIFFYFFLKYYLDTTRVKYIFLSAFFLGASIATKYNSAYLALFFLFMMLLVARRDTLQRSIILSLRVGFIVFIGFFICNPFFIIKFNTYFHNLKVLVVETKYYWKSVSHSNHLGELSSPMYLNMFGLLILLFGIWNMLKRDKRLLLMVLLVILMYESYFGIFLNNYSPLRYLNPLFPVTVLLFSAGIDFIIANKRRIPIMIIFLLVSFYNYVDIWRGMTVTQTHLQKARSFIETHIPERTVICITSNNYLPQLNMTEESYYYLMNTVSAPKNIKGYELSYKDMDDEKIYDTVLRKLRMQSLTKRPCYNFIRWDDNIKTEIEAVDFLRKNKVAYIISKDACAIGDKRLEDTKVASLIREFKPYNKRIYKAVYADVSLFLYKVN